MSELLKSGKVGIGEKTVDETIKIWESLGFLDGLEGVQKIKTALLFEEVAKTLIDMTIVHSYDVASECIIFPVTRRIVSEIFKSSTKNKEGKIYLLEATYIIKRTSEVIDDVIAMYKKHFSNYDYDIEAEAVAFVSKTLAQEYVVSFRDKTIVDLGDGKFDAVVKI